MRFRVGVAESPLEVDLQKASTVQDSAPIAHRTPCREASAEGDAYFPLCIFFF